MLFGKTRSESLAHDASAPEMLALDSATAGMAVAHTHDKALTKSKVRHEDNDTNFPNRRERGRRPGSDRIERVQLS